MNIYTRTGDSGETSLIGGARVSKAHPRLEAVGTIDELNALLGVLGLHVSGQPDVKDALLRVQRDLFTLGAALANPNYGSDGSQAPDKSPEYSVEAIEADIDRLCAMAPPLKSFVIPTGNAGAVHAHHASTVCRRAERAVVRMAGVGDQGTGVREQGSESARNMPGGGLEGGAYEWVIVYLNRLNDWLFALARALQLPL